MSKPKQSPTNHRVSHLITAFTLLAACGSSTEHLDAAPITAAAACESVGTAFCQKAYTCFTAQQLMDYQLPATQAECVTEQNTGCDGAMPIPGYCKGSPQTSAEMATACAADLNATTCDEFTGVPPPNDVCKTQLCSGD